MAIYWSDPIRAEVRKDALHVAPWTVIVFGFVHARTDSEAEAYAIAAAILAAIPPPQRRRSTQAPPRKGQRT